MSKRKLSRVGEAAIAARMTDWEVRRDPERAFHIALNAMRATIGAASKEPTA